MKWCPHRSGDVSTIGRQQNDGGSSCLPRQIMKELEAGVIGCVKIDHQQDHRTMFCEVGEEGCSGLEERPMFLLWITRTQPLQWCNGFLVKSMWVFCQIAGVCVDERLAWHLPFSRISCTVEW